MCLRHKPKNKKVKIKIFFKRIYSYVCGAANIGGVNKENMESKSKKLMRECVNRFGKDWKTAKISIDAYGHKPSNNISFLPAIADDDDDEIWGVNGVLHSKGKWATPLTCDIHTDIQSLKDKYPQFNITVSVEERKDG